MNRGTILAFAALAAAASALSVAAAPGPFTLKVRIPGWAAGRPVPSDLYAQVAADRGRLAVERGPILYCAEGADNAGGLLDASLPADATFAVEEFAIGDRKFPALRASNGLLLVPYCLWGNRQPGNEMQTWFLEK